MALNPLQSALCGIVTVLNTPFSADNQLDADALAANVRNALDAGVSGFLVPAMASEVNKLSAGERLQMVQVVVSEAGGRVPVGGDLARQLGSGIERKRMPVAGAFPTVARNFVCAADAARGEHDPSGEDDHGDDAGERQPQPARAAGGPGGCVGAGRGVGVVGRGARDGRR